jgi:DNA-binding response OmpR family regulator
MSSRSKHIAIVEDDDHIRELLAENLRRAGYQVSTFFTAEQFQRKSDAGYHMLLLDIMLPGKSGIALLKDLHAQGLEFPVILLTASEQEAHVDAAFATGAIDYIVKPFNLKHLLQKIENLFEQLKPPDTGQNHSDITIGAGRFKSELNLVIRDKKEYKLTPAEAATLLYFLRNPNRIISREELQASLGAESSSMTSRNLDNYVLKFRKLFEYDPKSPVLFVTIPRKGYALKR